MMRSQGLVPEAWAWSRILTGVQYAIRARNGWRDAEKAGRPRVDILARLEEVAKDKPQDALSDKEITAEMMEIL